MFPKDKQFSNQESCNSIGISWCFSQRYSRFEFPHNYQIIIKKKKKPNTIHYAIKTYIKCKNTMSLDKWHHQHSWKTHKMIILNVHKIFFLSKLG